MEPKYPEIVVPLVGRDGNAGAIMGRVAEALRKHGVPREEIDQYRMESMSGDYENLLQTCMRWVTIE
jgi:hypothetical protein